VPGKRPDRQPYPCASGGFPTANGRATLPARSLIGTSLANASAPVNPAREGHLHGSARSRYSSRVSVESYGLFGRFSHFLQLFRRGNDVMKAHCPDRSQAKRRSPRVPLQRRLERNTAV